MRRALTIGLFLLACSADTDEEPWVPGPGDDPPADMDMGGDDDPSMEGGGDCKAGFADCDRSAENRCEADLSSLDHCGACGRACDLANAESMCAGGGRCTIASCASGFADCDEQQASGCELDLRAFPDSCENADSMADAISGDTGNDAPAPREGTASQWLRITITEDDTWNPFAALSARFTLEVPDGVDYDLILWDGCSATQLDARETGAMGEDEILCLDLGDTFAVSDTRDVWIEVRFRDGSTCAPWRLSAIGHMSC